MKLVKLDIAKGEEFVTKTITVLDGINRLQAEKSSVVESYNRVKQEYYAGKISFAVYKATVERMNAEVDVIDSMINDRFKQFGCVSSIDIMELFLKSKISGKNG